MNKKEKLMNTNEKAIKVINVIEEIEKCFSSLEDLSSATKDLDSENKNYLPLEGFLSTVLAQLCWYTTEQFEKILNATNDEIES